MRILTNLALTAILVLAASAAGAAEIPPQSGGTASFQDNFRTLDSPGVTTLKLSSMYVEIQEVFDRARETEQLLLKELAAASRDEDVDRIVNRIEHLQKDRDLAVLRIQVRYARLEERWDVEYRLRTRIMKILENEAYAVK